MKVKFSADAKKVVTVSEVPAVKKIIAEMREDDGLKGYAEMAAKVASKSNETFEILRAEAEIAKNRLIFDSYGEGSGTLDIWLTVYAFNTYKGFYDIGVYLSDIWNLTGDNAEEIRSHMYIDEYTRR